LVRAVVANELNAQAGGHGRWMYRVDREEQSKKKAEEVVQTGQGSLDRLVAVDGQPLNAKEEQDERARIGNLVRNPAEQQRLEQTKKKDAEQCQAFFKMIPDALTFIYAGWDGDLIKLSYRPNPSFQPPSREARVFHKMECGMWVHETQRRLVRMRGQLMANVKSDRPDGSSMKNDASKRRGEFGRHAPESKAGPGRAAGLSRSWWFWRGLLMCSVSRPARPYAALGTSARPLAAPQNRGR